MTELQIHDESTVAPDQDHRRVELGRQLRVDAIRGADAALYGVLCGFVSGMAYGALAAPTTPSRTWPGCR